MESEYKKGEYETCQCRLMLFETKTELLGQRIWILVSVHKKSKRTNVRFGNECQIRSMLKTYRNKRKLG